MQLLQIYLPRKTFRVFLIMLLAGGPVVLHRTIKYLPPHSQIRKKFNNLLNGLSSWMLRGWPLCRPSYDKFLTMEQEQNYWETSARCRRRLAASDAHFYDSSSRGEECGEYSSSPIPLVIYYTPRLLPPYRDVWHVDDDDAKECLISARTFCKWHRMVFRGPLHPTIGQAQNLIKYYSHRDLKEMQRISRMATDEAVFVKQSSWTPRFRKMWQSWLDTKGPDIAIIFE